MRACVGEIRRLQEHRVSVSVLARVGVAAGSACCAGVESGGRRRGGGTTMQATLRGCKQTSGQRKWGTSKPVGILQVESL